MMIVWRIRRKIITAVLCTTVVHNHNDMHTYLKMSVGFGLGLIFVCFSGLA